MADSNAPLSADTALFTFYDIESLTNAFTLCTYTPATHVVEMFYLIEPDSPMASTLAAANPAETMSALIGRAMSANPAYAKEIVEAQPTTPPIRLFDLSTRAANDHLLEVMGLRIDDYVITSIIDDVSPEYDPTQHAFIAGYNSYNYDTTMLALYLANTYADVLVGQPFMPTKPSTMRAYNDDLFTAENIKSMPRYLTSDQLGGWQSTPNRIRSTMINSGRHIDIARLNEAQQRVAEKRLLGMMGHQILESDKLSGDQTTLHSIDELADLLAYNVSDVVGLHRLFQDPTYSRAFELKHQLMLQYPETRFDKDGKTLRRGRLTPDTTSARFVAYILAPYAPLPDIETVSFLYPHEDIVADHNAAHPDDPIQQVDVLDESRRFFYENIEDEKARAAFDEIYTYYDSIRGKNFNESDNYRNQYITPLIEADRYEDAQKLAPLVLREVPKRPCNIPYFKADGSPSSCFATFSTGGIHGAEANIGLFEHELAEYQEQVALQEAIMERAPRIFAKKITQDIRMSKAFVKALGLHEEGVDIKSLSESEIIEITQRWLDQADVRDPKTCALMLRHLREIDIDGEVIKHDSILTSTSSLKKSEFRSIKEPSLFVESSTTTKDGISVDNRLHNKYAMTSYGEVIHEDFTSYYPNLLRNMRAFYNPELGEDRYAKIFEDKERYGRLMKDPSTSPEDAARYSVLRNGTKLILNAASGAGDATHDNSIRMNNTIISMRLIGQLFSWRIGQAQTLAGARIVSTNTDGLYSVLDAETNNRVLAEQAAAIRVEIEPEPLRLVSKDANNRMELTMRRDSDPEDLSTWKVSASGASLVCWDGPTPTKSLAHPAVTDAGLVAYMRHILMSTPRRDVDGDKVPLRFSDDFDSVLGRSILEEIRDQDDSVKALMMFQNVIAASRGSVTYPYMLDSPDSTEPRILQHINRLFVVDEKTPGAAHLHAAGTWKVNAQARAARKSRGEQILDPDDPIALKVLEANGWARQRRTAGNRPILPEDENVQTRRWTGIDPEWPMLVVNHDLRSMAEPQRRWLLGQLDIDAYLEMLRSGFEDNWAIDSPAPTDTQVASLAGTDAQDVSTVDPEQEIPAQADTPSTPDTLSGISETLEMTEEAGAHVGDQKPQRVDEPTQATPWPIPVHVDATDRLADIPELRDGACLILADNATIHHDGSLSITVNIIDKAGQILTTTSLHGQVKI